MRRTSANLVVPEGSENEVHLDEDGPKGQQAAHEGNHSGPQVPLPLRDGGGYPLNSAGIVRQPVPVATYHLQAHALVMSHCRHHGTVGLIHRCRSGMGEDNLLTLQGLSRNPLQLRPITCKHMQP